MVSLVLYVHLTSRGAICKRCLDPANRCLLMFVLFKVFIISNVTFAGVQEQIIFRLYISWQLTCTPGEPRDLLDALLSGSDGEGGVTDDHILMTAAEAFGAGVETTSTTLLWTIAFLLHYPEV